MSHARELIFLEKWSDKKANNAATSASSPTAPQSHSSSGIVTFPPIPISPTSPKATKFCCCPNRRRYHIKEPKSISTFNARNIFIDNDFHFIDEFDTVANCTTTTERTHVNRTAAVDYDNDDDDYDEEDDESQHGRMRNESVLAQRQQQQQLQQQQTETQTQAKTRDKDKAVNNSDYDNDYDNANSDNERDENRINSVKTRRRTIQGGAQHESQHERQQEQQQHKQLCHHDNCGQKKSISESVETTTYCNCNNNTTMRNDITTTATTAASPNQNSDKNSDQDYIQRLNNKPTNISSDPIATTEAEAAPLEQQSASTTKKMTITTTTNVANRKRSECEAVDATTTTTATVTPTKSPLETPRKPSLPLTRPQTSSLKTVIKTTMVKRSPSTDTPPTTPTTLSPSSPTCPSSAMTIDTKLAMSINKNDLHVGSADETARTPQTPLTVKERIAALVAENEQANRISGFNAAPHRNRIQCKNSTMTITTKCPTSRTSSPQKLETSTGSESPTTANDIPETPRITMSITDDSSNNRITTPTTPTSLRKALNGGVVLACATMPRRRLENSPATTPTKDATTLMGDRQTHKLSTLDNLDLALKLQANDVEDDEDPYVELQEYLEKVKHEINEAFESHKLQQRMHHQQQQQQDENTPIGDNDELSNSRESDSQLNSTNGQHGHGHVQAAGSIGNANGHCGRLASEGNNKLPAFRRVSTSALTEISCQRDINGHPVECDTNQQPQPHQHQQQLQQQQQLQLNSNERLSLSSPSGFTPPSSTSFSPMTTNLRPLSPPLCRQRSSSSSDYEIPSMKRSNATNKPRHMSIGGNGDGDGDDSLGHGTTTCEDVNIWANKFLRDLDNLMASDKQTASITSCSSPLSKTSPMLLSAAATAAIQSRYGKHTERAEPNAALIAAKVVLKPEKHATIPLQSFNLDCGRIDNANNNNHNNNNNIQNTTTTASMGYAPAVAYMRTLSAPTPYQQHQHLDTGNGHSNTADYIHECLAASGVVGKHNRNSLAVFNAGLGDHHEVAGGNLPWNDAAGNTKNSTPSTILKIEEIAAAAALAEQKKRQHCAGTEGTAIPSAGAAAAVATGGDIEKNMSVASAIPNRERINHAMTKTPTTLLSLPSKAGGSTTTSSSNASSSPSSGRTPSYLLNGNDATKKGSTSTIWTSEESILRSVGAADEDNNSTSSSACEEASGVLSSSKSGISLDSSGLDNDNNESGIGTATPPKDMSYWKSVHNDNESLSSLDAGRKMKFQKSSSVASSDDPDLLEVLSLCDEPHGDEDTVVVVDDGEDADEGHDDFETVQYCDCEYTDGDGSSTNGGRNGRTSGASSSGSNSSNSQKSSASSNEVVLRRRHVGSAVVGPFIPSSRVQKSRSHSLDPSSHLYNLHLHAATPPLHHGVHSSFGRKLHTHLQQRVSKERAQLTLALRQEPFQSLLAPTRFQELPSPSSASLHSGHESLGIQELTTKSNSAPLLLKQEKKRDDFAGQNLTLRYSRSQSDRYLAEIEAVEACKWLRAAGFPQYAQMYEDHQFPIDLTNVAKDHTNLENDQLQSLYRRLCILNRCANMRLDQSHKAQTPQKEDSDDENFALSENWTFQPHIRRWSRIGEAGLEIPGVGKINVEKTESSSKESSPDRFEDDSYDLSGGSLTLTLPGSAVGGSGGDSADSAALNESNDSASVRLRRTGSERLKDGAKAFLRRVESIKSRRRKRQNREGIVISGPQALDLSQLGQRSSLRKPDAVYSTPPSPSAVSPMHTFPKNSLFGNELKVPSHSENFLSPNRSSPKRTPTTPRSMRASPLHFFTNPMPHLREGKSDDSSSYYSDSQESSTGGRLSLRKMPSKTRRLLQRTGKVDDIGAHSDSECHQGRKLLIKDANSNNTEVKVKKLTRGGSLNLGKDPKKRDGFRTASFRSRSTTRKDNKTEDSDNIKRNPVVRWHSFQMEERPHMIFRKCFSQKVDPSSNDDGIPFAAMSAGQLQIIRKLALVVLTGHMERYCPTHRSGWNWELPKFIKKIKMPDYKDKRVFGVPLLLILQRTGQTLPIAVRSAFRWLQLNALDQIGIFRKSGVKSRIIKLKELIEYSESTAECMDVFDVQQAYDVADMLKQYFRDLPESLLTTKMSETFAAIFQHLPPEVRLDAVQSAVLLLPDENREILFALLEFLTLVAANSQYNQMTSNNLAVCLAPSLFHNSISTGTASVSASPRRRGKGSGVPDVKELSEAKASHECLSFMIDNYKAIFTASKEKITKCNFGYMEESKPVPLEALGEGIQFHNWRGYLYECTSATIKEGREKTRGWITVASTDSSVEIAYKKVGDGHPLRLWRCITEVEGPPKDVLAYIVQQRASWDVNLLQSQTVKKLDEHTEIFQYALDGQITTDFCVLRAWQTDLPRGACVIVETSIDHAKAKPLYGAVRGVVLASRYLIEPCGSGRSRVMHLARVDIKGKTPEWYNKSYGHICSHYLSRIRIAFKNVTEGPESKV